MRRIIHLLLLSFSYLAASTPCLEFVQNMYQRDLNDNYQDLTPEETYFLDYSAKSRYLPDYGNKTECDKTPGMKYYFAIRSGRRNRGDRFGSAGYAACLPESCASVPGLSTNQTFVKTVFLSRNWGGIKHLPSSDDYEDFFRIEDPTNWDKPALYYPSIALFSLFTLAAVISTIYLRIQRKRDAQTKTSKTHNAETPADKPLHQGMMEAFDLNKNALQLYQTAKEQKVNDDIAVFGFLRTLSCYWVILYHTFAYGLVTCFRLDQDPDYKAFIMNPVSWLLTGDGVIHFFFMAGFFALYAMVGKLASAPFGVRAFLQQLKHRILRIWPLYMILLLLYSQIGPFLWSSPAMHIYQNVTYSCHRPLEIIIKMLFLDVILDRFLIFITGGACWENTWYIATEFHIYWVGIIVVGVYAKYRKSGRALIIALILQSIALAQRNYNVYDHFQGQYAGFDLPKYLRTPCTRWYTFFHGALWASFYYEYSKMNRKNIFTLFEKSRIASYISIALGITLIVEGQNIFLFDWKQVTEIPFHDSRHLIYELGVALLFMPLISKRQFLLKTIMNLRFFQIAGKTSFVVYLLHDFVFRSVMFNTMEFRKYNTQDFLEYALINICIAQILGVWIYLCIEKPLVNIELCLTKKRRPVPLRIPDGPKFVELKDESTPSSSEPKENP